MRPARSQRPQELRILNAVAEALNSTSDVQEALSRTLTLVADSLGLRTGWVWLVDAESGDFYSSAVQNLPPYLQEPVRMTGYSCWCIEQFRSGKLSPKNIDVLQCSRLSQAYALRRGNTLKDTEDGEGVQGTAAQNPDAGEGTAGLRYHASIPLYFQEQPLGIMNVATPSWRQLTPNELRLLSTIAYQVGIAIERARLAEESNRLARAEERTHIAREIHDTLAQELTAIALHIEGAMSHLESDPQRARQKLQRALDVARVSLEEARRSVLDLRGAPLNGKPLTDALRGLARSFSSETGIRVHVDIKLLQPDQRANRDVNSLEVNNRDVKGDGLNLPLRMEAELFRITQEALTNVQRHARATEVHITLRISHGKIKTRTCQLLLSIRDNGQGIDHSKHHNRQGIIGMMERARLLHGTLRIQSTPGRGTTIHVRLPLPNEEQAPKSSPGYAS